MWQQKSSFLVIPLQQVYGNHINQLNPTSSLGLNLSARTDDDKLQLERCSVNVNLKYLLTGMDLKWFWRENYVLLLPTYPLSLKKDMDFLHEQSANKLSNSALGDST